MSFKARVLKLEELYKPKQMHIKIIDTTEDCKAKFDTPLKCNCTCTDIPKGKY